MFCDRCQVFWSEAISKAGIPHVLESCEDIDWSYHQTILHHSIRTLKRASDLRCRLCRLIYYTPTDFEHETLLKDQNESLEVVLIIDPNKGPHPVLLAEFCDGISKKAKISKRWVASCSGILNDGQLTTTLRQSSELENNSTGSDGALTLAAFWVKRCLSDHDKCRLTLDVRTRSFVPTRLVDVSGNTVRLIESRNISKQGTDQRFVALSHCWGQVPIIRTLIGNYEEHCRGIAPAKLSKTFREAIHTTRFLGYRYIWIDSLCIKQDDGADWATEAATMCDVYRSASLTIAAAHAPGGDIGCFTERDGLLKLPFHIEVPRESPSAPTFHLQFTSYGRVKDVGGGDPALYGRAWVLQEQILSPRMLIFDGEQIKWECLAMYGSESSPTSGTTRHSIYQKHIRSGIMGNAEYFSHTDSSEASIDDARWSLLKHQYWCYNVMDYTHRGMTNSKDRLAALAGISSALGQTTKYNYLAGIWSEYFTIGLLWYIAHNEVFQMSASTNFDIEKNEKIRPEEALAPSWSWASVTVPVMYASNELLNYDRICEVISTVTSGSVDKQTGHAELRGHIRRGHVNAVYPYSIREAAKVYSHMTATQPKGNIGREEMNFKGRMFHPNDWFLFSEKLPTAGGESNEAFRLTVRGNFRLVRGSFKPDEIINPAQEITFIAIAQQHFGTQLTTRLPSHEDHDALKVHTLALVPTESADGTYRRVGLAIWDECAWYGYLCGWKDSRDRIVEKPGRWTEDGRHKREGWWDKTIRKLGWDDLEYYKPTKAGNHDHSYESGRLPDFGSYHKNINVEERVLVVV